jgi:hypothetical protein
LGWSGRGGIGVELVLLLLFYSLHHSLLSPFHPNNPCQREELKCGWKSFLDSEHYALRNSSSFTGGWTAMLWVKSTASGLLWSRTTLVHMELLPGWENKTRHGRESSNSDVQITTDRSSQTHKMWATRAAALTSMSWSSHSPWGERNACQMDQPTTTLGPNARPLSRLGMEEL